MAALHDRPFASPAKSSAAPVGDAASPPFDILSDVLGAVRLTGSMLFLVDAAAPWKSWAPEAEAFRRVVLPRSQHMISFHIVTQGSCWAGLCDAEPQRFEAGDVMVIPHGDAYHLCDPPEAERAYGRQEAVAFFELMAAGRVPTLVRQGGGGSRRVQFICGFLGCDRQPFNPVLTALPRMLKMPAAARPGDRMHHLLQFAVDELGDSSSGGHSVLLRLAELMFVEIARRHFAGASPGDSGWLAGLRDPLTARALAHLHRAPARPWTLDAMAAACGASRTVLAERFAQIVGTPPMQYLARWRMQLATRLLADPENKVATVAHAVGYESEAAFSRQFRRMVGLSPHHWRRTASKA